MYTSGFIEGKTEDRKRTNWAGDRPRPLSWAAWYPADSNTETTEKLDGPSEYAYFTMGQIAENASISDEKHKWPLVLLSHGTGGSVQGTGWLARLLAEQGFIVLGVNHHGNTSKEPYLAEGFLTGWERTADLSAILDQAESLPTIGGRIDMEKIFATGFSFGGATVIGLVGAITNQMQFVRWLESGPLPGDGPREFPKLDEEFPKLMGKSKMFRDSMKRHSKSYLDNRVKAVVALAPAPTVRGFTVKSLKTISVPVKIMTGEADEEAPFASCSLWLKENNDAFDLISLGKDVGHYTLVGISTDVCRENEPHLSDDLPGVNRMGVLNRVANKAADFFNDYVEG
ncbi:hypothetical protein N9K16_02245 [Alphaproteobacteria bacterium]|nr:hypothetical protein [Alphaproteobacteria bacterium]